MESGIVIIDAETRRVLDVNPAAVRMYGDAKEKMIGKVCYTFFGQHECPILDLNQTLDHTELKFIRADGTVIPILKSATQTYYHGRSVLLESFSDISHVKEAEAQKHLLEMGDRTRVMLDATPMAAQFWDENMHVIDCNQAAVDLLKTSSKQEYIERYFDLTPEYQPDGSRSFDKLKIMIDKTYKEGNQRFEWMRRSLDGELIPVEVTLVRTIHKGKDLVIGYCRDLRGEKQMMQEIQQRDKVLYSVISNYAGAIWSVNKDGIITLFNGLYLEKIGVTPDFLEGKNINVARNKNRHLDIIETYRKPFRESRRIGFPILTGRNFTCAPYLYLMKRE